MNPRKQRTREHIIADQSINDVERFIIDAGHVAERVDKDYGYDLLMTTFDENGFVEPDQVYIQVKASETLVRSGDAFVFDIDIRDYNLWVEERNPVILVLFDASRRRAYWVWAQQYLLEDLRRRPAEGARTVRVRVPARQAINRRAMSVIRGLKRLDMRSDQR